MAEGFPARIVTRLFHLLVIPEASERERGRRPEGIGCVSSRITFSKEIAAWKEEEEEEEEEEEKIPEFDGIPEKERLESVPFRMNGWNDT